MELATKSTGAVLHWYRLTLKKRHKKRNIMSKFHRKNYSESFKLEVLRDYYASGLSKNSTAKKWGLTSNTYISRWQKCYPIDSELLSLSSEPISQGQMKNDSKSREQILEEENLRLKKALETEKLRSRAFQKLIELTEKEEGISILKKDGARQ